MPSIEKHAADTNNLDADPLATGFEAIAVGYSLRFPDDLEKKISKGSLRCMMRCMPGAGSMSSKEMRKGMHDVKF